MENLEYLEYRPVETKYIDQLQKLWSDEDMIRYMNISRPLTLEETKRRMLQLKSPEVFLLFRKGEFAGIAGCLRMDAEKKKFGLFYQIRKCFWGQGCGTMAAAWILDFMKKKYSSFTILADVIEANTASWKILENMNFSLVSQKEEVHKGAPVQVRNYKFENVK